MDKDFFIASLQWRGIKKPREIFKSQNFEELIKKFPDYYQLAKKEFFWLKENHFSYCLASEEQYPKKLLALVNPPEILCYKGDISQLSRRSLAVVGSRKPLGRSQRWLDEYLEEFISKYEVPVVSGGARGIDQKAHSVCLRLQRPTICFLPSGFRRVYPPEINLWMEDIVRAGGVVVSPFSPFSEIFKSHFYWRNEMIVHISDLTLVVEAAKKSGSMLTAQITLNANKNLVSLPGTVFELNTAGNLQLQFDGVPFVRDFNDLSDHWLS